MSNILKNILIVLTVIVLAGLGYYLIVQRGTNVLSYAKTDVAANQTLLTQTQVFIQRHNQLESLHLDLSLFNEPRFTSLITYTQPLKNQTTGKDSLFDTAIVSSTQ